MDIRAIRKTLISLMDRARQTANCQPTRKLEPLKPNMDVLLGVILPLQKLLAHGLHIIQPFPFAFEVVMPGTVANPLVGSRVYTGVAKT